MTSATLNTPDGETLVEGLEIATSLRDRMLGLLRRDRISPGHGLLIAPCSSIHTFFMRFEIDVVFLDENKRVLGVRSGIPPWRLAFAPRKTDSVLEVAAGWLDLEKLRNGTRLRID